MTKEEYSQLLIKACGGHKTFGEISFYRREKEREVTKAIGDNYWGYLALGDAIHQFYNDTLILLTNQDIFFSLDEVKWLYVNWHAVSHSRFYNAFNSFYRGYYYDACSLSRSIWESALSLTAIEKGIITTQDLFCGGDKSLSRKQVNEKLRKLDRKIEDDLIWKNPMLSCKERESVEFLKDYFNKSTHKSRLHLLLNIPNQKKVPSLYPYYDKLECIAAGNILYLSIWFMLATLKYLGPTLACIDKNWAERYDAIISAMKLGIGTVPKEVIENYAKFIGFLFKDYEHESQSKSNKSDVCVSA